MSIQHYLKIIEENYKELGSAAEIIAILGNRISAETDVIDQLNALLSVLRLQDIYNSSKEETTVWSVSLGARPKATKARLVDDSTAIDFHLNMSRISDRREPISIDPGNRCFFKNKEWALEWRVRSLLTAKKKNLRISKEYLRQAEYDLETCDSDKELGAFTTYSITADPVTPLRAENIHVTYRQASQIVANNIANDIFIQNIDDEV